MKKIATSILLILTFVFLYIMYDYISYRDSNAVSDAAFVKSDAIYTLSFKVGGKIDLLSLKEGDKVSKNSLIASINKEDFLLKKENLEHNIKALIANRDALVLKKDRLFKELGIQTTISKNNISISDEELMALKKEIYANKTKLDKLKKDRDRYKKLVKDRLISKSDFEKIDTSYKALKAKIEASYKKLNSFKKSTQNRESAYKISELKKSSIKEIELNIKALNEQIEANKIELKSLQKKISYCDLKSPVDGVVAKRFVNLNQVVSKGTPIYSIVDTNNKHVEVLLSEKKLHGVKIGNSATIKTEADDKTELKGVVESILPTSASTFSLVPRDIASGEFTKLDQRFVVRISFKESKKRLKNVLIGMGATVAIQRK